MPKKSNKKMEKDNSDKDHHVHHIHHTHREHHTTPHAESPESFMKRESNIEDHIVENMVKLQKVHTDLAEKFDKLAKEISNLLALFELAAKNFSRNPATKTTETDKEFLEKIDKLLEQNKTIAKGLTLMEDQMRKKMYHPQAQAQSQNEENSSEQDQEYTPSIKTNRPLPRF